MTAPARVSRATTKATRAHDLMRNNIALGDYEQY